MNNGVVFLLTILALFSICESKNLIVGTSYNNHILWQQKAEYSYIPLKKRVKEVFYSDPAQQIIKGIVIRDLAMGESIPSITAGGVGFSYVNIRLKSERGGELNYQIEIYG